MRLKLIAEPETVQTALLTLVGSLGFRILYRAIDSGIVAAKLVRFRVTVCKPAATVPVWIVTVGVDVETRLMLTE